VIDSVVLPVAPCAKLTLVGDAATVKLGGPFTVNVNMTEVEALPAVPVTVTELVPVAALELALKVTVLVVAVVAGLKEAVTPLGRPDAVKLTFPLKPLFGVTVKVLVAVAPCVTVKLELEAPSEKVGAGVIVNAIVAVAVRLPELPVTVRLAVLAEALEAAVRVRILAPLAFTAPKVPVAPLGSPEIVRFTVPEKPFRPVI
jgi:hypothetical protein